MPQRHHVVITGTGRAGTTFLVELLSHLGLDTGFSADEIAHRKYQDARAGLEHDVRQKDCPFIAKDPYFCDYVEEVIRRDDILIEHIFVPFRDLDAAAESRRHVAKASLSKLDFAGRLKQMIKPRVFAGGLWQTQSRKPGEQERILLRKVYDLMLAVSDTVIPVTLIRYPRLTKDAPYLFGKLEPVLKGIPWEHFRSAFEKVVRPELVHSFNKNDG